jgi:hypothetical protein
MRGLTSRTAVVTVTSCVETGRSTALSSEPTDLFTSQLNSCHVLCLRVSVRDIVDCSEKTACDEHTSDEAF